jgi:hypothetical protein
MSQVLCCRRCPLDPLARRTGFGTSLVGCKAQKAPALPVPHIRLRGRGYVINYPCFVPFPLSHLLREVHDYRVSRVRQFSLTIAASVTWASWRYGSSAPLARVPTELDLMPAMQGYPHRIGWVRTELPYQLWQTSFALRHGLAPRPVAAWADSSDAGLEEEPRREQDGTLGAEIEERPRQPLPVGRSMPPRGALTGVLVCRSPVRGHGYPSVP